MKDCEALISDRPITPRDAVKLLYQAEFGCGHIVSDENAAAERFFSELEECAGLPEKAPCEIGGGFARAYMDGLCGSAPEALLRAFTASAKAPSGSLVGFKERIRELEEMTAEGRLPFSKGELSAFLGEYAKDGYPMLSHSEAYRQARNPHYRVILSRYLRLLPLIGRICEALDKNEYVVCALDGRAASGKSTAAALIASAFCENGAPADIVAMDDFFLPPELRSVKRLAQSGGNVHYERFREEILPHLRLGKPYSYRRFDCSQMALGAEKRLSGTRLTIVEGAYSLSCAVQLCPEVSAFVDIGAAEQLERIKKRDTERLTAFKEKWIPMEEAYISSQGIREKADLVIY